MDNHHVLISSLRCSCGGIELAGLSEDPKKILYAVANYLYHPARGLPAAFMVWSDLDGDGSRGYNLHKYIKSLEFKEMVYHSRMNTMENPKTGNHIAFFIWEFPHEAFREWWKKERVERLKRV
jgi:hypothetical protein